MSIFGQKLPHEANKYTKKYVGTCRLASADIPMKACSALCGLAAPYTGLQCLKWGTDALCGLAAPYIGLWHLTYSCGA